MSKLRFAYFGLRLLLLEDEYAKISFRFRILAE